MIELCEVRKTYQVGSEELPVLKGISLEIADGEYVALMGTSGSGKTTLMNLLGSLDHLSCGSYHLGGIDVSGLSAAELAVFRNRYIGFVFQNFNLLPRMSALDNVLLPTVYAHDGRTKQEAIDYAKHLLQVVGLGGRMDHEPNQLSGGERQRVAIARALINRPQLLLADEPTGNLDTRTEQEILQLFGKLNEEHKITLVVVTHDAEVAQKAKRIVHIRDGVISNDVSKSPASGQRLAEGLSEAAHPGPIEAPATVFNLSAIANVILVAAFALRRNALRTALTMLGVVIGVASVVNVIELSSGASHAMKETVASMGASTLTVMSTHQHGSGRRRRYIPLTPNDVKLIKQRCPLVEICSPLMQIDAQVVRGNSHWRPTFAFGTTPDYLEARRWANMDMGQTFSDRDVQESSRICLLGQTVATALFGEEYPIGQQVRVNGVSLRVLGVLSPKGADVIGNDQDDTIVAPWTTFKYRLDGAATGAPKRVMTFADQMPPMQLASFHRTSRNEHLQRIHVKTRSPDHVTAARDQIQTVLCAHHDVESDVFQIHELTEVARVTNQVVSGLSALGLLIGGVSLLVGGVGIMNIMLVSVTERTREIGLRMAVGADRRAILRQFLIEATSLCMLGGFVGIGIGHGCAVTVSYLMGWPSIFSIWAPIVAVSVSATVGIVFGYYPARQASLLDPIDALRFE